MRSARPGPTIWSRKGSLCLAIIFIVQLAKTLTLACGIESIYYWEIADSVQGLWV